MKTLPEAMQTLESDVMSAQPPGPEYEYDDPGKRLPQPHAMLPLKHFERSSSL